jgi:hypothetical protein
MVLISRGGERRSYLLGGESGEPPALDSCNRAGTLTPVNP